MTKRDRIVEILEESDLWFSSALSTVGKKESVKELATALEKEFVMELRNDENLKPLVGWSENFNASGGRDFNNRKLGLQVFISSQNSRIMKTGAGHWDYVVDRKENDNIVDIINKLTKYYKEKP